MNFFEVFIYSSTLYLSSLSTDPNHLPQIFVFILQTAGYFLLLHHVASPAQQPTAVFLLTSLWDLLFMWAAGTSAYLLYRNLKVKVRLAAECVLLNTCACGLKSGVQWQFYCTLDFTHTHTHTYSHSFSTQHSSVARLTPLLVSSWRCWTHLYPSSPVLSPRKTSSFSLDHFTVSQLCFDFLYQHLRRIWVTSHLVCLKYYASMLVLELLEQTENWSLPLSRYI